MVRSAREEDLPGIIGLHLAVIAAMARLAPPGYGEALQTPPESGEVLSLFSDAAGDAASLLAVAEAEGQPVGYVLASLEDAGDDLLPTPYATVVFIGVAEEHRGRGIARELLMHAEEWARERGARALDILVWSGNSAARSLYTKLGYSELELRMGKLL